MNRDIDANANENAPAQTRPLDKDAEPEPEAKKTRMQSSQEAGSDVHSATSLPHQNLGRKNYDNCLYKLRQQWAWHPVISWDDGWNADKRRNFRVEMRIPMFSEKKPSTSEITRNDGKLG